VQRDRVRGFIATGLREGATLLIGGLAPPAGLDRGFYVQPTIFTDVRPDMSIAQEEIFGPVLSILPYDTEAEAVSIANGTIYGLASWVWSSDPKHAMSVARKIRVGQVFINEGSYDAGAPAGGYKQSGLGREHGRYGFEEFLEVKSVFPEVLSGDSEPSL
jgi:aldehyde dehydrogenase (NAD+)